MALRFELVIVGPTALQVLGSVVGDCNVFADFVEAPRLQVASTPLVSVPDEHV